MTDRNLPKLNKLEQAMVDNVNTINTHLSVTDHKLLSVLLGMSDRISRCLWKG